MRTEQHKILTDVKININIQFKDIIYGTETMDTGGFGVVYRGKYKGETVAIKQLRAQLCEATLKLFENEAKIMAQLRHDNVLMLYGVCLEKGNLSMILPYAPKGSLYGVLRGTEPLDWPTRIKISLHIARGLNYLHRNNPMIIHRDLKSMNVLLFDNYTAKISDFGLSEIKKEVSSSSNVKKSAVGSIPWMAPEIFGLDPKYSTKSDIYAYAILLLEIATRKLPYHKVQDPTQIQLAVAQGQRDKDALIAVKDVPSFYTVLIQQAWDQIPDNRPEALALVEILEQGLSTVTGVPVQNSHAPSGSSQVSSGYQAATPINLSNSSLTTFANKETEEQREIQKKEEAIQVLINAAKELPQSKVDDLLKATVEGHLVNIEKLLQATPSLVYATGTVTDHSGRTFKNITAFQYAVWSLDLGMAKLFIKYQDINFSKEQIGLLMNKPEQYSSHGTRYEIQSLCSEMVKFIEEYYKISPSDREKFWCERVGKKQREIPAWLVYVWCDEEKNSLWEIAYNTRSTAPLVFKKDFVVKLVRDYDMVKWWWKSKHDGGPGLGSTGAIFRCNTKAEPITFTPSNNWLDVKSIEWIGDPMLKRVEYELFVLFKIHTFYALEMSKLITHIMEQKTQEETKDYSYLNYTSLK